MNQTIHPALSRDLLFFRDQPGGTRLHSQDIFCCDADAFIALVEQASQRVNSPPALV
ncbi:hypothetical protein EI42_04391 [Thermosporothrix hazakensis]|jgi:hypothetical protein|uniref:Uncharacterized protein n=1 Tax=Thermosporothrix hazakensis TaxID=644383 RepID=A0A326U243_THEHA|nr:hypothetical protein EI42_04391 [Thermosporothrix hazakensis]